MTDTRALAHLVCCDANLALCGVALAFGNDYADDDETPTCPLCSLIDEQQQPCGDPGCDASSDDTELESELPEEPSWMREHPRRPVERMNLAARPAAPQPASASPAKRRPPLRGTDHRRTRPGRRRET